MFFKEHIRPVSVEAKNSVLEYGHPWDRRSQWCNRLSLRVNRPKGGRFCSWEKGKASRGRR